jgi:hypothetical protein
VSILVSLAEVQTARRDGFCDADNPPLIRTAPQSPALSFPPTRTRDPHLPIPTRKCSAVPEVEKAKREHKTPAVHPIRPKKQRNGTRRIEGKCEGRALAAPTKKGSSKACCSCFFCLPIKCFIIEDICSFALPWRLARRGVPAEEGGAFFSLHYCC